MESTMLSRLISQWHDLAIFAFLALTFGFVKTVLAPEPTDIKTSLVSTFVAVFFGTLSGALCLQLGYNDYTAIGACSFASLVARDVVVAVLKHRHEIGNLLKMGVENLINKFTR